MNKRTQVTRKNLKDSLISLIAQQDLHTISVVKLAEMSNINRCTFYVHYKDVADLVNHLEQEVYDAFKQIVYKNIDNLHEGEYFKPIFEVATYIKGNRAFIKAISSKNGDPNFTIKVKEVLTKLADYYAIRATLDIPNNTVREAYVSFMISGGIGVFEDWIQNDCASPADVMINSLIELFSKDKK